MNIALTQRTLVHKNRAYDSLEQGWYSLLKNHTLFCVPNSLDHQFNLDNIQLLIVTGGDDHPKRRIIETRLIAQCYAHKIPILGICHGALLINDLEEGVCEVIDNHLDTSHKISMQGTDYEVNSYHNMSIQKLGADLQMIATASDGSIEGFRHKTKFVFGLMWHPERMENPVLPEELSVLL